MDKENKNKEIKNDKKSKQDKNNSNKKKQADFDWITLEEKRSISDK